MSLYHFSKVIREMKQFILINKKLETLISPTPYMRSRLRDAKLVPLGEQVVRLRESKTSAVSVQGHPNPYRNLSLQLFTSVWY